ncbi:hypothetical protein PoB_002569200 [Plakobranchus ocellatus]|uniref:Uncharacterized protein n=1 Tax=Plakobranchus ocellatus TaxID=259542 RepID=A0AAV3ZX95_9GAST|nr:hypothetical protein PoB_002569200 [Plakobranchus ocellatus]
MEQCGKTICIIRGPSNIPRGKEKNILEMYKLLHKKREHITTIITIIVTTNKNNNTIKIPRSSSSTSNSSSSNSRGNMTSNASPSQLYLSSLRTGTASVTHIPPHLQQLNH